MQDIPANRYRPNNPFLEEPAKSGGVVPKYGGRFRVA